VRALCRRGYTRCPERAAGSGPFPSHSDFIDGGGTSS
jgi:hypothetical protein